MTELFLGLLEYKRSRQTIIITSLQLTVEDELKILKTSSVPINGKDVIELFRYVYRRTDMTYS